MVASLPVRTSVIGLPVSVSPSVAGIELWPRQQVFWISTESFASYRAASFGSK